MVTIVLLLLLCSRVSEIFGQSIIFTQSSYTELFEEEQPVNSIITTIEALAFDANLDHLTGTFSLGPGGDAQHFIIENLGENTVTNINSANLRSSSVFDWDQANAQRQLSFSVIFTSTDGTSQSVQMTVLIEDRNDNPPKFPRDVFNIQILEELPGGSAVLNVSATDPDQVIFEEMIVERGNNVQDTIGQYTVVNGLINYSIIAGNGLGHFAVNPQTGILFTSEIRLDVDLVAFYNLTIMAVDGGGNTDEATILITILDSNDNAPQIIYPYGAEVTISEDTSPGYLILAGINATDLDAGINAIVHFSIIGGNPLNSFAIDAISGEIVVAGTLDREVQQVHNLTVAARDQGLPLPLQDVIYVVVYLLDVNDYAPRFMQTSYTISVSENSRIGSTVMQISAEDLDEDINGTITYSIVDGGVGRFSINPTTGEIFVITTLDREETNSYVLLLQAVDNPFNSSYQLSSQVNVTIQIEDINDNPPIFDQAEYVINILDNVTRIQPIIQLRAVDKDSGTNGVINYRIDVPDPIYPNAFRIDQSTGMVFRNRKLSFQNQSHFIYTIVALDKGPLFSDNVKLTIILHDVNENPPVFNVFFYNNTISENAASGMVILNVSATDIDSGPIGKVRYRIVSVFDKAGSFEVDENTGEIRVASRLDFDVKNEIDIIVEAFDGGFPEPFTDRVNVTVTLTGLNDEAPLIVLPDGFQLVVPENTSPGFEVAILRYYTVDPDLGHTGEFSFKLTSIYDNFSINASFALNETTGLIQSLRTFDRELQPEGIILTVTTIDFEGLTREINLTIMIGDVNDNNPVFEANVSSTVHEFLPVGTEVLSRYEAVDDDIGPNAALRYFLFRASDREVFSMDSITGGLYTTAILNKTIQDKYNLTVMVIDQGSPVLFGFGSIMVEVLDSNDMIPTFSLSVYEAFLLESSPVGTLFFTVNATDTDSGTNAELRYVLTMNDSNSELFTLDELTGELFTNIKFDREEESMIDLIVTAVDSGLVPHPLTGSTTVTILIQDVNDHSPIFNASSYEAMVVENAAINTTVATVYAFDGDATSPNNLIRYSLQGSRSNILDIDPSLGLILITGEMDWEEGEEFTVDVVATDQTTGLRRSSSVDLTVSISDVNDNAPIFMPDSLLLTIKENTLPGEYGVLVGLVSASDADSPGNKSIVTYSILMDFSNGKFTLDPESGEVSFVRGTLNRERRASYNLLIRASDQGYPYHMHTDESLLILVEDANDFDPVFDQDTFSGFVEERAAIGTSIITIYATDADVGTNAEIRYSFVDSTTVEVFEINEKTGVISVADVLDFENVRFYPFQVVVSNIGEPHRYDTACVEITVKDSNDHPPFFDQFQYSAVIRENLATGTVVLQVSAQDADTDLENMAISFSLLDSVGIENFGIHNETGVIYTNTSLDREQFSSYNLTILANNSLSPHPLISHVQLFIDVMDLNDMHPTFPLVVEVLVFENASISSVIHTFEAYDGDEGLNGAIKYSLLKPSELFSLNPTTGELTLLKRLDEEGAQRLFMFPLTASDLGIPPLNNYTNVLVRVLDSNNHVPMFAGEEYSTSISSEIDPHTTFLCLEVMDADEGSNALITMTIISGNELGLFEISVSGGISPAVFLRPYIGEALYLRVEASDGDFASEVNVTIYIQGRSNTLPRFTNSTYTASLSEVQVQNGDIVVDFFAITQNKDFFSVNSDLFSIDNTGIVTVANSSIFDFEIQPVHQVTISIENVAGEIAYTVLTVDIMDVNEYAPIFISDEFLVWIPETMATGEMFFTAIAVDRDGFPLNSFTEYDIFLTDTLTETLFGIDGRTGELMLTSPLSYESGDRSFNLTLRARNTHVSPTLSSIAQLQVAILNGNSFPPQFDMIIQTVTLLEDVSTGLNIITVIATDGDFGSYGSLTYGIHGDHNYLDFRIDTFTGAIYTNSELDFEQSSSYTLEVFSSDSGSPVRSGNTVVRILIEDLNDNAPIWDHEFYSISLVENVAVGSSVAQVLATDRDHIGRSMDANGNTVINNRNGYVTYSITQGDPGDYFSVDYNTGLVSVASSLDHEVYPVLNLTLNATDGGGIFANAYLHVVIHDFNDVAPLFMQNPYSVGLSENAAIGTIVATIAAVDNDLSSNSEISYFLNDLDVGFPDSVNLFSLNITTGDIVLETLVDREIVSLYILTVVAVDMGEVQLTGTAQVMVNILDINEFPPIFSEEEFFGEVFENEPQGTPILQIHASDVDFGENGTVYYSIVMSDVVVFAIESETGVLVVDGAIDFEDTCAYELVVQATDAGAEEARLVNTVNVTITILDRNDNQPSFLVLPYVEYILESFVPGDSVLNTSAIDSDSGSNSDLFFSLEFTDKDSERNFVIDNVTGAIILSNTSSLDRERMSFYSFTVSVMDSGNPSMNSSTTVSVAIGDVNDNAPQFILPYFEGSVRENLSPMTSVMNISATDADIGSNADLIFSITKVMVGDGACMFVGLVNMTECNTLLTSGLASLDTLFIIDPLIGLISTLQVLDRENVSSYVIEVTVKDGGQPQLTSTVFVLIRVLDKNDHAPSFSQDVYFASISEHTASGQLVLQVEAQDSDSSSNAEISFILAGSSNFTVNMINGEILTLTGNLDREEESVYNLTVIATDRGEPSLSSSAIVILSLLDENDSPPMFAETVITAAVRENKPLQTFVVQLNATDADIGSNSELTFYISSSSPALHFEIDPKSGILSTTQLLDRERFSSYFLVIIVEDGGSPSLTGSTQLDVTVTDDNDFPPAFIGSPYEVSVSENTIPRQPILSVTTFDQDTGSNGDVYYSMEVTPAINTAFEIGIVTGDIYLLRPLDVEIFLAYNLTVRADNAPTPSKQFSETVVIVNVIDLNDNAPIFGQLDYMVPFLESNPVGTLVIEISAFDEDVTNQNSALNFEISGGFNTNHFNISSTKPGVGAILVTIALDREKQPQHNLEVTVFDSGSPQMNATTFVTIELQDANDNTPVFEQRVYAFNLVENSPLFTLVGRVQAKDLDQQNVTYSLNTTELFRIESASGEIYTTAIFDREVQLLHSVTAVATDVGALLQRSVMVTINISIVDMNDVTPQFTKSTYYVQAFENTPILTTVLTVEASDSDSGENGSFTFFIVSGNDSEFFSINVTNGDISLEMRLDYELQSVMELYIAAADNGTPSLTSTTLVVVKVLDNNDNIPVLNSTTYTAILPEDSPTGTMAIYVSASDRDTDRNADITFSLLNDFSGMFEIGEKDGVISLVKSLDYEQTESYIFFIRAQDGGLKSLHSSSLVVIEVMDLNDNYPQFDSGTYQVFIPENAILDTSLFQIPATDMDSTSNGELRYSILSGNLHSVFAVDEKSGIISVSDYLDREVTGFYSLVIRAVDQGAMQLTATAQLEISVLDVNDHSPILDSSIYSVSVSESSQIGTVIFKFEASDLDIGPNANLTYSIVAGNSGAEFQIGTNSGNLSLARQLDAAVIPSHALTVIVSDNRLPDSLIDTAVIRVVISDHNSHPPSYPLQVYFSNISQDVPVGSPIGHFLATDKDLTSRGILSYRIVNGLYFSVDSLDGVVYVSRTLVPGEFLFSLETNDGVFTTSIDIHITVVPLSATMTATLFDEPSYYFEIAESVDIDTSVGLILPAGEFIPNSTSLFRIDSIGKIVVSNPLDHEAAAVHVLNVVYSELVTGVSVYAVIAIKILDTNDNPPQFESDVYRVTVSESIPPGSSLTILQAFDVDSTRNNSAVSLSLSTQGNEDEAFFLDSSTGILYSTTYLDYEYSSSYLLTAVAVNEMATPVLSGTAQIVIFLLDYNDNTPYFSEMFYQVSIPELTPIGTDIFTPEALDNDSGTNSELVFSITHLDRPLTFTMNQSSGVISTNTEFDIESVDTYVVTVRVADRGNPRPLAASTVVFIEVTPDNIFSPVFSNPDGYNIEIPETLNIGGSVIQVVAKDSPSSDVSYSIVSGGLDGVFFIDPLNGVITLSNALDFNVQSFYTFSVQAEDGEVPSLLTLVDINITVQDINNHVPQFDQRTYAVAVSENITLETSVLRVVATDEDTEDLTYLITRNYRNAQEQNMFNINSTTGVITAAVALDRETSDVIEILVTAMDSGYPIVRSNTIPVVIEVLDINDNPPVFNSSEVISVVLMLLSEGRAVLQVVATDVDLVGETPTYEIISDNSNGLFRINSLSGVIETTRRVPETTIGYSLNITAYDGVFTTTLSISLLPEANGDFCEGNGYCTSVRDRNCTFDIFPFVECNQFCSRENYVLSPAGRVCVSYSCVDALLVPCTVTETCQSRNVGCNGTCPLGMSLCPTTNICYMITLSESCDDTGITCLEAQSLVQRSDQTRECAVTDTLPSSGQHCNNESIYCEELNTCMILTAPDLCQPCPGQKLLCPGSRECVADLVYCCGTNEVYCEVLNTCLGVGRRCELPNVSPKSSLGLIYLQSISNFSEDTIYSRSGHVIYELLGNGTTPAVDSQGEEISVAIIGASQVSPTFGEWQFSSSQNSSWTRLVPSQLSETSALLLPNTAHLRFVRRLIELDGAVWLRVKLWDGNQDGFLSSSSDLVRSQEPSFTSTIPYAVNSAFSLNSILLVILVHPLNSPPSFLSPFTQLNFTNIQEDVSFGENLGNTLSDVIFSVNIPDYRILSPDQIEGLPDTLHEQLLPAEVIHHYYSDVSDANPTRIQRQFALQSGQFPGVAVTFDSIASNLSGNWQVALTNDPQIFVSLDSVITSDTGSENAVLLNTTARLRFLPGPSFCGTASIMLAPWDGYKGLVTSSLSNGYLTVNIPPSNDFSSLRRLSYYNLGLWERGVVTVQCTADSPLVFETHVQISVIPYQLTYVYERLFTLLVDRNISSLREEAVVLTNYLHVVLQHQISIKRLSPTPAGRTLVSITLESDALDFKAVSRRIILRRNTLALLNFDILNVSQGASYGPGAACLSTTAAQYHGDCVSSLAAASAVDVEQDILGLAVVGTKPTPGGVWQYQRGSWMSKSESSQSVTPSSHVWLNFPSQLLPTKAFVLHGVDRIRFLPYPEYFWTNESSDLPIILAKVWDMSSSAFSLPLSEALAININTDPHTDTVQSVHRPIGLFSSDVVTIQAARYGCDEVVNSGIVHDACCVCGGTGESCVGCDGVRGSNISPDSCDVCNGTSLCVGCNLIPFSRTELGQCNVCDNPSNLNIQFASNSFTDCNGDCHGSALLDDCGVCSGGGTAHDFNSDIDCTGACFGGAAFDTCGDCTGPGTLLTFDENLDCTGICGGNFLEDSCGVCQLPGPDGVVKENKDCSGKCFGSALTDSCGVCYGGSTNISKGSVLDSCGVCYGNDSTCVGCDGEINSGQSIDRCDQCGGNNCGCFVLHKLTPTIGPIIGGTAVTLEGAGFFSNDTALLGFHFNSEAPNCGAPTRFSDLSIIPIRCLFRSSDHQLSVPGFPIDQASILCMAPISISLGSFTIEVSVNNGPFSSPLDFLYYNQSTITTSSLSPVDSLINTETTVTFLGEGFINSTAASCLIYSSHTCTSDISSPPEKGFVSTPATFVGNTEVRCVMPSAGVPCQVTVHLSFDGQESGRVETTSAMTIFTYRFSSPQVTGISFVDDLSGILLVFDRQVAVNNNLLILSCVDIFDEETFSKIGEFIAVCAWENDNQESILLTLPASANVPIGSPLTFKNGVLRTRNELYSYSITNLTLFVSPESTRPIAVINGPGSIPFCGQVSFSGIHSQHPGYSGFEYFWSILVEDSTIIGFSEITEYIVGLNVATSSTITLNSSLFLDSELYIVHLYVVNAPGLSSETKSIQLLKDPVPNLNVFILGASERTLRYNEDLWLQSVIVTPECGISYTLQFEWKLVRIVDQRRNFTVIENILTVKSSSQQIFIPSAFFTENSQYEVHVCVRFLEILSEIGTASLMLTVLPVDLAVHIHGGNRTVSSRRDLVLDARNSTVSSSKLAAAPTYNWRCQVVDSLDACYNMTATESPIPKPINLPNTNFILLPSSTLASGKAYRFRLRMEQEGRVSEGEVVLSFMVPSVPIVELTTNFLNVILSEEVSLFGFVYSTTSLQIVQWQSVQGKGQGFIELSAPQVVQSQVSYFPSKSSFSSSSSSPSPLATVEANTTNRVNLILSSTILDPYLLYTFRLSATNTAGTSYAEVTLYLDSPPKSARLYSIPTSGIALEMEFELGVSGALDVAVDVPLLYQFGIVLNDSLDSAVSLDIASVQWLSGLQVSPFLQTVLPSGEEENSFTLNVLARIYDRNGGHSDVHSSVVVLPNPSLSTDFFNSGISQLHSNLNTTKDWITALSNFIAYLSEMNKNSSFKANVPLKEQALLTFLDIFDSYLPVSHTHISLAISVFSAITVNQSVSDSNLQRIVSKSLIAIAEWFKDETAILPSFLTVPFQDEPLLLQGSYLSPEREIFSTGDAVALLSSWMHLLESDEVDHQIRIDFLHGVESVSNVLCQQISTGESPYFVNLSLVNLYAIIAPPEGIFNVSGHAIGFGSSVTEIYRAQACTVRGVACSEACFVGALYHTTQKEGKKLVQVSKRTREKINKEIEGSDPFKVELFSAILSVSVSIPSQSSYLNIQNLSEPVQVLIPVKLPIPDNTSTVLCLYREVGGASGFQNFDWLLDNTEPPTITMVESVEYYSCLFYHLSEFAIGLLPSPIITSPPPTIESETSPTTVATTATTVMENQTTHVPVTKQPAGKSPAGAIAGVVTVCLIVGVVCGVFSVLFLLWRQKKKRKIKIVPDQSSRKLELDPAELVHSGPLTPAESKIPMDIIQCMEEGKRTMLGKMTVLPSIRLRELRYEISDNFPSLKNRPFYFLNCQLCDIEPTTEQQQFVSIVFGEKPIFIRKVRNESMQTKKHFCSCGNAAQFECSNCSSQGYCSPECQRSHWVEKHQKECSRLSERKRRTGILYNRQNATPFKISLSPISETQQVPMSLQSPTSPMASDWKAFILQKNMTTTDPQQKNSTATYPQQKNSTATYPQQQLSLGHLPGGLSAVHVGALSAPARNVTSLGSLSRRIPFPQSNQGKTPLLSQAIPSIGSQPVLGPLKRVPLSGYYGESQAGSQHPSLSRMTSIVGNLAPPSPQSTTIPPGHSLLPAFPERQRLQPSLNSTSQQLDLFSRRPPPHYLSPIHLSPSQSLSIQSIGSPFSPEIRSDSLIKSERNNYSSMDRESDRRREEEAVSKMASESHLPPTLAVFKKRRKKCSSSEPSSSSEDSDISYCESKSSATLLLYGERQEIRSVVC